MFWVAIILILFRIVDTILILQLETLFNVYHYCFALRYSNVKVKTSHDQCFAQKRRYWLLHPFTNRKLFHWSLFRIHVSYDPTYSVDLHFYVIILEIGLVCLHYNLLQLSLLSIVSPILDKNPQKPEKNNTKE
jgi:hypothetical protein